MLMLNVSVWQDAFFSDLSLTEFPRMRSRLRSTPLLSDHVRRCTDHESPF